MIVQLSKKWTVGALAETVNGELYGFCHLCHTAQGAHNNNE